MGYDYIATSAALPGYDKITGTYWTQSAFMHSILLESDCADVDSAVMRLKNPHMIGDLNLDDIETLRLARALSLYHHRADLLVPVTSDSDFPGFAEWLREDPLNLKHIREILISPALAEDLDIFLQPEAEIPRNNTSDAQLMQFQETLIENLFTGFDLEGRDTNVIRENNWPIVSTGGLSYGDDPTDSFQLIALFQNLELFD